MNNFVELLFLFLADAFVRFRQWLTWRRALHIAALLILLISIRQIMIFGDAAFLLGLDWGLILEVLGAMILLAARAHTIATAQMLRRRLQLIKSGFLNLFRRGVTRARRTRSIKPLTPPSSDDDAAHWAWSPAPA